MGEGKGSTLVHLLAVVLCLVAFGFAIAAERRRSTADTLYGECSPMSRLHIGYMQFLWGPLRCVIFGWGVVHDLIDIQSNDGERFDESSIGPGARSWGDEIVKRFVLSLLTTDPKGNVVQGSTNATFCVYDSDIATGYGVGSFLFLLSSESLVMGVTKCMCFGRPLAPGGNRAWSIIYFSSSWLTFLIAEACLIAGAAKNAYHTKYRGYIYAQNLSCTALRKGVFIAGAVFVVFTMVLNVYYYMYFTKATSQAARKTTNKPNSSVGMTSTSF